MNFEKITEYLDSLPGKGIPSVDCMIYENHKPLYRHMAGHVDADGTKDIQGNEKYLMFSMTKVQTMACVMQLVERGLLSLEDEVAQYLPAYKELMVETPEGVKPCAIPMKIKHLVSMQSGLDYDLSRPGILRVLKEKGAKATTRELVDAFVESPLKFQPGEHYEYSLSHDVMAAIIEVITGKSFGEYLKENIWEPLQMKNTFFAKPMNDHIPNLVKQFTWDEKGQTVPMDSSCCYQLSESYESGGAGLVSTTEDYAVFGDAMACGGISKEGVRILQPESIELMKQDLLNDVTHQESIQKMGRLGYGYGCGVQVLMEPELLHSKAPAGIFGWDGAAGSLLIMDTATKRSLVYTMHVRGCGTAYGEVHPSLRELLFS